MDENELAMRRKELEREFEDKIRDLKAQHKRQAAALEQDRLDWDNARREKDKSLADRAEKARREDENIKRQLEELKVARRELEAAKALAKEHDAVKGEAKAAHANEAALAQRMAAARSLLGWFAFVAIVGAAACLYAAAVVSRQAASVAAGVLLVAGLALEWRRRRLPR